MVENCKDRNFVLSSLDEKEEEIVAVEMTMIDMEVEEEEEAETEDMEEIAEEVEEDLMITTLNVSIATDLAIGRETVQENETAENATTAVNWVIKPETAKKDRVHLLTQVEAEVEVAAPKEKVPEVQDLDPREDQEVPKKTEVEAEARATAEVEVHPEPKVDLPIEETTTQTRVVRIQDLVLVPRAKVLSRSLPAEAKALENLARVLTVPLHLINH